MLRHLRRRLTAGLGICALILIQIMPGLAGAVGAAAISINVAVPSVVTRQQFVSNILVSPNNAVAGVQFDLTFNPALVTVDGVTEGNLLTQAGAKTYFAGGRIDNVGGKVSGVAGVIVGAGQTVSSAGTFAVIKMTAKATTGTCPLNLSNVVVGDVKGNSVPTSILSGQVVISAANAAPVLASIGDKSVTAGQLLRFTVSATDSNGDTLAYSASGLPSGASFEPFARVFSWASTTRQVGSYPRVCFQVSDGTLTVSEEISITVKAAAPPVAAGGGNVFGGGGFGGEVEPYGGPTGPGITNLAIFTDSDGLFNISGRAESADGLVHLTFDKGVKAQTKGSAALKSVSITPMKETPSSVASSNVSGPVYEFGPEGAVFNPGITLTFSLDRKTLPVDTAVENLRVVRWDGARWDTLGSSVDATAMTISANVSHFSIYGVAWPAPIALAAAPPPVPTPPTTNPATMPVAVIPVQEETATSTPEVKPTGPVEPMAATGGSSMHRIASFNLVRLALLVGSAFCLMAAIVLSLPGRRRSKPGERRPRTLRGVDFGQPGVVARVVESKASALVADSMSRIDVFISSFVRDLRLQMAGEQAGVGEDSQRVDNFTKSVVQHVGPKGATDDSLAGDYRRPIDSFTKSVIKDLNPQSADEERLIEEIVSRLSLVGRLSWAESETVSVK